MTTAEVDATPGDCESLQQEEYEVLESIYPECISSEMKNKSLRLEIPVEFGTPRTVHVEEDQSDIQTNSAAAPPIALSLSSLPPVTLNVVLPALYPIKNPPTLTSIRAAHFWLPQIPRLHQALTDLWEPGEGVLYNWIEFLRSGEFLDTLSLLDDNNDIRIIHPSPPILTKVLKESDASSSFLRFTHNSYPCSICLSTVRGSKCVQLSCTHIFCRPCLEDFWKLCIEEGDVGRVGCPDLACVKDGREADAEEVARVVTQDCMERWRSLKIKRNLERGTGELVMHVVFRYMVSRSVSHPLPHGILPDAGVEADGSGGGDRMGVLAIMSGMLVLLLCAVPADMVGGGRHT
ncbi:hypothetical protein H2248_000587 [Termitomyces sp. 'cryptogamus']|nr:hypothetical protein H2248_000587 [Termitomyces sp. 'cryptogamus']